MKTWLPWIAGGTAAVLLCAWKFSPRRPAGALTDDFHVRSHIDAVTEAAPALLASASLRDENASTPISPSPPSAIDEGLRRLELDICRAAQISDANERQRVLIEACVHWADIDPADALGIARELGFDQVSNGVFEEIVQKWADTDFPAALAWANNEAAGEQRDHLMTRLAFVQSQIQPDVAAKLVVEQIPAGPAQVEAGISVLHQWALRDFGAALTWVNSYPGDLQDRARAELAGIARYRLARSEAR